MEVKNSAAEQTMNMSEETVFMPPTTDIDNGMVFTPYTALELSFDSNMLVLALYELYMSKINIKDTNTRTQSLRRSEIFQYLKEKRDEIKPERLNKALIELTNKPAVLRTGDFVEIVYLFEKIRYNEKEEDPEIFFTCTQSALPVLFLVKQQGYAKHPPVALDLVKAPAYNLYNLLQRHLYEAVNFNGGKFAVKIDDLRKQLRPDVDQLIIGQGKKDTGQTKKDATYSNWADFNRKVLKPASTRVNEATPLKHKYEVGSARVKHHYTEVIFTLDPKLVKMMRAQYSEEKKERERRQAEAEAKAAETNTQEEETKG